MTSTQGAEPSFLSHMKAAFSQAKGKRRWFWRLETCAAVVSVVAAFLPNPVCSLCLSMVAIAVKGAAKAVAATARAVFGQAERARRYDFERRTLGWSVPAHAHGELLFAFSEEVEDRAREYPVMDSDYYATQGPPSTGRLLGNLAESIFWTEKLMEIMAGRRSRQLGLAVGATVLALVGLALVQRPEILPHESLGRIVPDGLRILSASVAALIAVDVYGDLCGYRRGASECAKLFLAIEAAMHAPQPDRDEGVRLFVEYNCILVDLPMVPDEIHEKHRVRLTHLWEQVAARLTSIAAV